MRFHGAVKCGGMVSHSVRCIWCARRLRGVCRQGRKRRLAFAHILTLEGSDHLPNRAAPRQRLARADGNSKEPLGIFMQLCTLRGGDSFRPDGLDEREIPARFEQISGVRKDFREIHLEKNTLSNDCVIRRCGLML